jgi:hypothetical protein
LQGILAIAVDQIILQSAQAGDLMGDVPRIGDHCGKGDDQADE